MGPRPKPAVHPWLVSLTLTVNHQQGCGSTFNTPSDSATAWPLSAALVHTHRHPAQVTATVFCLVSRLLHLTVSTPAARCAPYKMLSHIKSSCSAKNKNPSPHDGLQVSIYMVCPHNLCDLASSHWSPMFCFPNMSLLQWLCTAVLVIIPRPRSFLYLSTQKSPQRGLPWHSIQTLPWCHIHFIYLENFFSCPLLQRNAGKPCLFQSSEHNSL